MLFRKLKFSNTPHPQTKDNEHWYLIIRTAQELLDFLDIDSKRIVESFISIPANYGKNHLTVEQSSLEALLNAKAISLKGGQTLDPIKFLCDRLDSKAKAMFRILEMGREILVQKSGSFCDYQGFINIWNNPIIICELEKTNSFFPEDDIPENIDLLFLENGDQLEYGFEEKILGLTTYKNHYKLTNLKFQDPDHIKEMILKSKVIAIHTQIADKLQTERMLLLFSTIPRKTILLKTNFMDELKGYELFDKCSIRHDLRIL